MMLIAPLLRWLNVSKLITESALMKSSEVMVTVGVGCMIKILHYSVYTFVLQCCISLYCSQIHQGAIILTDLSLAAYMSAQIIALI